MESDLTVEDKQSNGDNTIDQNHDLPTESEDLAATTETLTLASNMRSSPIKVTEPRSETNYKQTPVDKSNTTNMSSSPTKINNQQQLGDHSEKTPKQVHQQKHQQQYSHQNHVQLLMSALDKLDPDKNGLAQVPKEITSSTLTTRLKGVSKINRLIEHCNDLCHSFTEIGAQAKYQESTNKFRDWILRNKIIEHIFGPNCHVEIIKQSHIILNFVAYSLNDDHVNVIWSASLLKHCGRQVLDLLSSLIRFMRTGPVLHLYWLVRNLNIDYHSEHTLLLISHILRFIWSHSPCINQIQYFNLQKTKQQPQFHDSTQSTADQEARLHHQQQQSTLSPPQNFPKRRSFGQSHFNNSPQPSDQGSPTKQQSMQTSIKRPVRDFETHGDDKNNSNPTTSSANSAESDKATNFATAEDQYQWLASCIFPTGNSEELAERSASSHSTTSESTDLDKDLQQSLLDAIKGVTQQHINLNQNRQRNSNSPVGETLAKGGGDGQQPADLVNRNVVDHILKSISDSSSQSSSQQKQSISLNETIIDRRHHQLPQASLNLDDSDREWLARSQSGDFLDNTSDVSACCSEEKNMNDFDDDGHEFIQDENTNETEHISSNASSREMYIPSSHLGPASHKSESLHSVSNRTATNVYSLGSDKSGSTSTSRNQETKQLSPSDHNFEHFHQPSLESISQFKELKKASCNLSDVTSQLAADDDLKGLSEYNLANLSDPGKTLLWDLLQDGKIEHLTANLHSEVENVLVQLVMSFGDRYIRYKFIEACLENLSVGTSVIISLRLLPKLMSFNTMTRNLSIPAMNETHTIVLWAEREHDMSQNFFRNLVDYYKERQTLYSKLIFNEQLTKTAFDDEQCRQLEEFGELNCKSPMFTHIDKIITRMSFLTFIYSKPFSPETMKLSREQMNQLWDCLTSDSNLKCSDVLFQWIYQQAVSDDFHGVNDELLDYVLKSKMPTLKPEHFRLRGLKLLEQLLWIRQDYECCHGLEHPATKLLWDIGLKATDDEVSMAAIRILNHFYIYTNHHKSTKCDKGINFMKYCMDHLHTSLKSLTNIVEPEDANQLLDVMQKVILLIRTHLEVFKAHWSFYLRILQLNNEADLISHRLNAYEIKLTMTIRLVCQAASSMDKTTIEVQAGDFVGELRAEIVKWWYSQVDRAYLEQGNSLSLSPASSSSSNSSFNMGSSNPSNEQVKASGSGSARPDGSSSLSQFTEYLLANHHSLRLLSHNQEIPFEWDERQINELDFKDMQVIYVLNDVKAPNIDTGDDGASNKSNESSQVPYMLKTEIPSILLLRFEYFESLMQADRFLGSFQSKNVDLVNQAKTLSRRVWEIIQILPTCPHYKEDLKRCGDPNDSLRLKSIHCSNLLSAECPQRLLYSLQIIDILKSSCENLSWGATFIRKGGLADIFDVFMSQKLLPDETEDWNEWLQECLAYLLKLLFQFGTKSIQTLANESSSSSSSSRVSVSTCSNRTIVSNSSSLKRQRRNRARLMGANEDRVPIPQFSDELLNLLADTDMIFSKLIRILKSSALCRSQSEQYYYVTMSSRAMIVHHVMSFLSSWCKSDPKFPKFHVADHESLLEALILNDTDPSTRREACNGFFKLHHACSTKFANISVDSINSTINSSIEFSTGLETKVTTPETTTKEGWNLSADLLKCLINFLPIAEDMKPPKPIRSYVSESDYIKELNSPGCKDYFWLTCRLIDSTAATDLKQEKQDSNNDLTARTKDTPNRDNIEASNQTAATTNHRNRDNIQQISKSCDINLFALCEYLVFAIRHRQTYETRDFTVEDDTLRGMLLMMVMALRREPTFRYTASAFEFVHELYDYLFAPPNQSQRYLPKCKSPATRSTAFDLMIALVERCPRNYFGLLELLLTDQHNSVVKGSYPTDYWPHDDCRSEVGFVGLINLGATCYLATCIQHLFMIPDLRYAILAIEDAKNIRHGEIMRELQKIFTFMLESERKAYNPRNFCKVYTMDNHPLNIAEQTDMTEFLTDLITKLEESSPELRQIIKGLFSGTLSNNVVSLDCPHISRTTEEFYTLRVQVADMRNLNDSLDELTVKDTLEGDNMYTCSTCEKKVRAEKRACITKLPRILCFNTMRYTFNMATMTKEKVNTHFSFPLRLDMADYLESNLMKRQQFSNPSSCSSKNSSIGPESLKTDDAENLTRDSQNQHNRSEQGGANMYNSGSKEVPESPSPCSTENSTESLDPSDQEQESETVYELIGVTVHTGNADGGHYYCFIRDCEDQSTDKPRWYLFNDAEVKPFDDSHIGTECYGGELTTKSYDAINDRFMDFSIEKTNSAYMLFYKRIDYEYRSKSVALRYLESDTQRLLLSNPIPSEQDTPRDNNMNTGNTEAKGPEFVKAVRENDYSSSRITGEGGDSPMSEDTENQQVARNDLEFNELCRRSYEDFQLPKHLANWIWSDNMKFSRDKNVFEHNYFNFMWQVCANLPRTLNHVPESIISNEDYQSVRAASDDEIAIRTVHLAIAFVLGVLMNSRERPNLSNWTELIRKQFNTSKAACDWLMHLIDDEETWLKQMLLKCPIEMVRQLFQRLCNDLTGSKQHKKLRLIK